MNKGTPPQRQGARFSLLTFFLVTTIVALSITVIVLYRELHPLRQIVARLRNEVGELNVEDPTKLHAIRVDAPELEWKWRIWIPEGSSFRLRGHGGPVAKEGYPNDGGTMYLRESGEHVVRYVIRRDPRDGHWKGTLHTQTGSVGGDDQSWAEWPSKTSTSNGVGSFTKSYPTKTRVELIRHHVSQAKSSADIEDPSAGFMVWLEPN